MYRQISKAYFSLSINLRRQAPGANMNKLIVRRKEGEEKMALSFTFSSPLVAQRQFNFQRNQREFVVTTLQRIAVNIGNVAGKKLQKLKKKNEKKNNNEHDMSEAAATATTTTTGGLSDLDLPDSAIPSVDLILNGSRVLGDTPAVFAFLPGAVLKVGDVEYHVEVNPPLISSVSLGSQLMAGFTVHPKLELEFSERKFCKISWYRSKSKFHDQKKESGSGNGESKEKKSREDLEWEFVKEGLSYKPSQDDVGRFLKIKCIPGEETGREGPAVEAVSSEEVGAGPGETPFQRRHLFIHQNTYKDSVRIVSYNILADLYADSDYSRNQLFPNCPPYALAIDYRKQLIFEEVSGYKADIVCLQEVDSKIFENYLTIAFATVGMEGNLACKGGNIAEGVACFYRKDRFRLFDHRNVELSKIVVDETEDAYVDFRCAVNANKKLLETFVERKTVMQTTILQRKDVDDDYPLICVANTHLYFQPTADHIRLLQAGVCLRFLEELKKEYNRKLIVVFCGDFNSTPESGVYELMTTRKIAEDHPRWRSTPAEEVTGLSLNHDFDLISAAGTPEFTNFTVGFRGCLDYIFIDNSALQVDEVIPMPSEEELTQHEALPSIVMPSDHIAVVCTLKWKS